MEAAFAHHGVDDFPMVSDDGSSARMMIGSLYGRRSPVKTTSETVFADVTLKAGRTLPLDPDHEERAIYVVDGELDIAGDKFAAGRLLVFKAGDTITIRAVADTHFVIVGGEPMDGPRHIWWNFVSSSKDRIDQAKAEWKNGRFDIVPGDAEEFIPLPDK
jgi:redox-sensitive bicupin YhaK (pirin superfamily)